MSITDSVWTIWLDVSYDAWSTYCSVFIPCHEVLMNDLEHAITHELPPEDQDWTTALWQYFNGKKLLKDVLKRFKECDNQHSFDRKELKLRRSFTSSVYPDDRLAQHYLDLAEKAEKDALHSKRQRIELDWCKIDLERRLDHWTQEISKAQYVKCRTRKQFKCLSSVMESIWGWDGIIEFHFDAVKDEKLEKLIKQKFESSYFTIAPERRVCSPSPIDADNASPAESPAENGISAGLSDLGCTSYMNATIQCLNAVPELKGSLNKYPHSYRSDKLSDSIHHLTVAARDLFNELDKNVKLVEPIQFLAELKNHLPRFFSNKLHDLDTQRDAGECWVQIVQALSQSLKFPSSGESIDVVMSLFGIELVSSYIFTKSGEERQVRGEETVYTLHCGNIREVHTLHEGIKLGLKQFCVDKGGTRYCKESRINGLPRYLAIQLDRFNRIFSLDKKCFAGSENGRRESPKPQEGPHLTGKYNLIAVLTHRGKRVKEGRYVAWVKSEQGIWIMFDDHKRVRQREATILKLSGGALIGFNLSFQNDSSATWSEEFSLAVLLQFHHYNSRYGSALDLGKTPYARFMFKQPLLVSKPNLSRPDLIGVTIPLLPTWRTCIFLRQLLLNRVIGIRLTFVCIKLRKFLRSTAIRLDDLISLLRKTYGFLTNK
ncbi:hypothetical protein RJ639_034393 [Escallonia herrerae]|uniref:ubiquitinyl hydrolase 1 n=1 Tax=Escallonia herrerae TaxID=1293975 RepID=A0AA89BAN0_9ASTE|nr:hypothetical protein RJ639_034393 [Escallonia herrerae]